MREKASRLIATKDTGSDKQTRSKETGNLWSLFSIRPWNLEIRDNKPHYKLVGSVLVAAAIQASRDEGCEGRFALHSLKQAEQFYKSCGMTDLGVDNAHEDQLKYFEMTKKAAQAFLPARKNNET